jgi:hypothetical protein
LGQYNKALSYKFQSLEMRRRLYGNCHNNVARSLNVLGTTFQSQRDFKKAYECLSEIVCQ